MTKKDNLTLELPNFEGPLDLLLHLIKSQKIDIYDIPIAKITGQYLAYLKKMQKLNLQIAGEYFVMSSTLLRIKSQYLLPKNDFIEQDSYEDDPREELVQQLVEYSVFKRISKYFEQRNSEIPITMAKEASIEGKEKVHPLPLGQITPEELQVNFSLIIRKLRLRGSDVIELDNDQTSIVDMIAYLENRIIKENRVSFFSCIPILNNLSDIVGLFLATLELCKEHKIVLKQNKNFGDFIMERKIKNEK